MVRWQSGREDPGAWLAFFFFCSIWDSGPWKDPPTFRVGLPSSVKSFWKHSYRYTQRCISTVSLNPLRLTMKVRTTDADSGSSSFLLGCEGPRLSRHRFILLSFPILEVHGDLIVCGLDGREYSQVEEESPVPGLLNGTLTQLHVLVQHLMRTLALYANESHALCRYD